MQTKFNHLREAVVGYGGPLVGALLFAIALNIFIVPHGLYSGTLTGVAQIVEDLILTYTSVTPDGSSFTGIVLMLINIPLLIMVVKLVNKSFLVKTVICVVFLTIAMTLVPVPPEPVLEDVLTSCIVAGAIAGFGAGFILRCGGSGGGSDLIGVYFSVKHPGVTIGRVTIFISIFVYSYALFVYDFNTVIYSALFTTIYALTLDHVHHQLIKTSALIFTTNPEAVQAVMERIGRGATVWDGRGAYSGKHTNIITTVISKYEVPHLKRVIREADPSAFVIFNNKVDVSGNFLKKL